MCCSSVPFSNSLLQKSCFDQNLSLDSFLLPKIWKLFIHAFITGQLDYYNSLLSGTNNNPSSISCLSKTLLPGFCFGLRNMITSHRSWLPYTGYLFPLEFQVIIDYLQNPERYSPKLCSQLCPFLLPEIHRCIVPVCC